MKKIYRLAMEFAEQISKDEIFIYAAQSAFYMITASIPFVMLFLALLKVILPLDSQEVTEIVKSVVPRAIVEIVASVTKEVFEKPITVISVTGVTVMWSASRGVMSVERGIKKVYGVKRKRGFFKNIAISVLNTLFIVLLLLVMISAIVFGAWIYSGYIKRIIKYDSLSYVIPWIVYFVVFNILFVFIYRIFSERKTGIREYIPGSVFATLGWFLFSDVFSVYVEKIADYSYVYGSLSVIVLAMLWLYICMIILLIGAEVNVFIKRKGFSDEERVYRRR